METGKKGPQGLRFNGEKYMVLRTTPEPVTVIGKKVSVSASSSFSLLTLPLVSPDKRGDLHYPDCQVRHRWNFQ
jgi:hypothetical protein